MTHTTDSGLFKMEEFFTVDHCNMGKGTWDIYINCRLGSTCAVHSG